MANSQGVVVSTSASNSPALVKLSQPLMMAYRELFAVVFKIPNESVKTRVSHAILAALNGDSPLRSCQRCSGRVETAERSSQTTFDEKEATETDTEKSPIISIGGIVKLGRKRRILAPQASTGADLGVSLSRRQKQPRPSQTKRVSRAESTEHFQDLSEIIEEAIDNYNIEDMIKDVADHKTPKNLDKVVKDMMLKDWIECITRKDGKLPIHNAVENSNEIYLRRQCLTLKNRGLEVDLKTTEGYTALHIALLSAEPDIQIIEVLLNAGADVSIKDPDSNNCLLLAAKYTKDLSVFTTILRKTPFSELQSENFRGHGIFRVVVDSGRVDFLNELIKYVDECLGLQSLVPKTVKDEKVIESLCRERLRSLGHSMDTLDTEIAKEINEKKAALLNQRDKTAGKTPLFCAVEKQKEIIVLALLANFADPQIKTHAGIEPYTLASEVLKNKKISTYLISSITAFELFFREVHEISSVRKSSAITIMEESSDEDEGESQKKRRKLNKN